MYDFKKWSDELAAKMCRCAGAKCGGQLTGKFEKRTAKQILQRDKGP